MNKIVIIGSSVAGASLAYFLADRYNVTLVEEHAHFKKTCSGIVTNAIEKVVHIPHEIVINKVSTIRINAPDKNYVEIKLKNPDYIYDREKLNAYFTNKAIEKGATLLQPAKFSNISEKGIHIINNCKQQTIKADMLIGADGALSSVAHSCSLGNNRKFFLGVKAYVKMDHDNCIDVYPNSGLFSWIVPHKDNVVEVGTFCYLQQARIFRQFLQQININYDLLISKEAALIPLYNPKIKTKTKINDTEVRLIGDAATMVKATTGGSIYQSIKTSQLLATSLEKDINFEKEWRKEIGRDLWMHLKMRNILDKLKENDWNLLVKRFQNRKLKEILETTSRDYSTTLALKLLLKDPGLITFLRFLF